MESLTESLTASDLTEDSLTESIRTEQLRSSRYESFPALLWCFLIEDEGALNEKERSFTERLPVFHVSLMEFRNDMDVLTLHPSLLLLGCKSRSSSCRSSPASSCPW